MSISLPLRSVEKLVSFGGICGVIGVVCDLMTPVGSYTLWALIAGAVIFVAGLVLILLRGWADQVAQAISAFGILLVTISIGFLAFAPEGDRGVLASEFTWVSNAQSELLGIKEAAVQIADNTAAIATNTSDLVVTTTDIATDTELVRNLSFSMEGFLTALASQDQINIRAYCDRGYRLYQTAFLFKEDRGSPQLSNRNYELLSELDCYDTEQICDSYNWGGLTALDPRRVAEICGAGGVQTMAQLEVDRQRAAVERVERQRECEAKLVADYGERGRSLAASCRPYF